MTWVNRLFTAWTGFVLLFFYLPIGILILFSFNESRLNIVWTGFTFDWYLALLHDRVLVRSLQNSVIVASAGAPLRFNARLPDNPIVDEPEVSAALQPLVERLRVLPLPGWRSNRTQPIDERDVIALLRLQYERVVSRHGLPD